MRILAIHSVKPSGEAPPVHVWRIWRPIQYLKRNMPEWEIEERGHLVESFDGNHDKVEFTPNELEAAARDIGTYDVVFMSYSILSAPLYALMLAVTARHGTQFVIDCDDNVFAINEDNPIWRTVTREHMHDLQTILSHTPWLTASTDAMASQLRRRRPQHLAETVQVLPNYITDDYQHPAVDHASRVTIGYMGGSSHWADIHDSGFSRALARLVRTHKEVDVRAIAMPIDIPIAESRMSFVDPVRGLGYIDRVFPKFDCDIMVGPLLDNAFNASKSNIKWQEATRAGAAFIASGVGPYRDTLQSGVDCLLVNNTRNNWYDAMEYLIENAGERRAILARAQDRLQNNWRLEDHWGAYRDWFENVIAPKKQEAKA